MTSTASAVQDIVAALDSDHKAIEKLLDRFDQVSLGQREDYFCEVVNTLVRHEVAEEMVVYPAIRSDAPNGNAEADDRIAEQSEAEQALKEMEKMDPESDEFTSKFLQLRENVLRHARSEEAHIFPLLQEAEDSTRRTELCIKYEDAKDRAPTHPHPHAPDTPPGNKIAGSVAAVIDRVRDAMKS